MTSAHKTDERVMKNIIRRNVKPTSEDRYLDFIIFYQSKKSSNLILKNNPLPPPDPLQRRNVIYSHSCQHEDCGPRTSYVGMTTTRLSRRLTCHLQAESIRNHHL